MWERRSLAPRDEASQGTCWGSAGTGIHYLEAWSEALCDRAWGGIAARAGEHLRRALDLDHWPAFRRSFGTMIELLDELAGGGGEEPPATITLIGGDVHTAYVAEIVLGSAQRSRLHQIVCSPFRNPLSAGERRVVRLAATRAVGAVMRALARTAGVGRPAADWRFLSGPTFDNSIAVLELDERAARVTVSRSGSEDEDGPALAPLHSCVLSAG